MFAGKRRTIEALTAILYDSKTYDPDWQQGRPPSSPTKWSVV
jgi:hypothetical protein